MDRRRIDVGERLRFLCTYYNIRQKTLQESAVTLEISVYDAMGAALLPRDLNIQIRVSFGGVLMFRSLSPQREK